MALWEHEKAILDLLDAGLSANEVAARGFSTAQVKRVADVIGTEATHAASDRRRIERMRAGSQALLRAIQTARKAC